jgi:ankyrin repeat protein
MGLFNWNKIVKVNLTNTEKKELEKDQELLAAVALINSKNGSNQSPLASMPGVTIVPPLIYACIIGKIFMVKDAINNGSNLNETDEDGITPLHVAAEHGYIEIVQLLINFGADKNLRDKNGILPIELAKKNSHQVIVELLND